MWNLVQCVVAALDDVLEGRFGAVCAARQVGEDQLAVSDDEELGLGRCCAAAVCFQTSREARVLCHVVRRRWA